MISRTRWKYIAAICVLAALASCDRSNPRLSKVQVEADLTNGAALLQPAVFAPGQPTLARVLVPNQLSVSNGCHALLFYGLGATDLAGFSTGKSVLTALTDEMTAVEKFGRSPFVVTRHGLRYTLSRDPVFDTEVGEAHRDQCLATFAALRLPLDTPVVANSQHFTLADLLRESIANFSFEQQEITWTAGAYAAYLPPARTWQDRFGQRTSFSQLATYLMRLDLNRQSCAGLHVLQALVAIARADTQFDVLDAKAKVGLQTHLNQCFQQLVVSQELEGCWNWQWCPAVHENTELDPFRRRLLVTGHLLETLLSVEPRQRPPQAVLIKAAGWIQTALDSEEITRDGFWCCPFTHAARSAGQLLAATSDA